MSSNKIRPEIVQVDVDWKAVGRRIRELRGFELTQADVAARIGICQGYLSTVEHGEAEIGAIRRIFKSLVILPESGR